MIHPNNIISRRQAFKLLGTAAIATLAAPSILTSTGCSSGALAGYRPITDVTNLDGRKVGVLCGWEPDLMLTGREDMTLCRYDTLGDMTMALCYRQIDAMCIDAGQCLQVAALVDGVEILEPPIGTYTARALFSKDCWDVGVDFDDWLATEFIGSSRQQDIQYRKDHLDTEGNFISSPVPTGRGNRTITLGVDLTYFPDSFMNAETDEILGAAVEVFKWFAYDRGYNAEYIDWTTDTQQLAAISGKIDCSVNSITDYYVDSIHLTYPENYCSESYLSYDMNLMQIANINDLSIKGDLG